MSSTRLDREEVRALYERDGPALLAYAVTLVHNRFSAEDVLHQVFTKLLQRTVVVNGPPLNYVYRAVRNTALNHQRSRARELEASSNGHWLEAPHGMEEVALTLQRALAALPIEQREVASLRIWGQLTFEEIAHVLDIPPNTAASRYRYALAKLRDRLAPLAEK